MELTAEQYTEIEKLSGLNYSPEKIALYFGIYVEDFLKEFNNKESQVRYHYDRGALLVQAKMEMELSSSAQKGNITAYQTYKKQAFFNKVENYKKELEFNEAEKYYNLLQEVMMKGESKQLTAEENRYYEQIDLARSLFSKYKNRNIVVNTLRKSFPELNSVYKASKILDEAINFFYLDSKIKVEAWANFYADWLDKMASICEQMDLYDTAKDMVKEASKMRGVGEEKPNELPDDFHDRRTVIYSINPEDVGLPKVDRHKLAKLIDEFIDIPEEDRDKIHLDAMTGKSKTSVLNIEDTDFTEIKNND